MTGSNREFVVVLRGRSGARFEPGDPLRFEGFPSAYDTADLTFRTRWKDEGHDAPIPRGLWVEVQGEAPSIDDAVTTFINQANFLASFVSVATNASVHDLDVELAFESTAGVKERDYFQKFQPRVRGIPTPSRGVPVDVAGTLVQLVTEHEDMDRLARAVVHYQYALRHWSSGKETLALMFLYMGMEALEPVARRAFSSEHVLTELEMAQRWDLVSEEETDFDGYDLQSEVRRRLLFTGDDETYRAAKDARTGLSHAYMGFDEVRKNAKKAKSKTAKYLRSAIFRYAGASDELIEQANAGSKRQPFESTELDRYLRGTLIGRQEDLAADGQEYPFYEWRSQIDSFEREEDGSYNLQVTDRMSATIGEEATFRPETHKAYGPQMEP